MPDAKSPLLVAEHLRPLLFRLERLLRREATPQGLTGGQAALLATVTQHPEYGVSELAALERVSAPAMTQYIDRLERAGFVRRDRSADDARRVRLLLTDSGREALDATRTRRTAWLTERIEALPPAEQATLAAAVAVLERLIGGDE